MYTAIQVYIINHGYGCVGIVCVVMVVCVTNQLI